jgi:hypothetical protein
MEKGWFSGNQTEEKREIKTARPEPEPRNGTGKTLKF